MSEIYRDPTDGANARRQELLRRRRDELATMPHAIRRVVVARGARAAAGLGLTIGGVALLAVVLSTRLVGALDHVLPGIQPAGAATMLSATWLLALAAYTIARARSEHRFAVAMSRHVLPGNDLDHDLQRLDHEHPDEIARGMAHRREVASAVWPVLGAALAVPPLMVYVAHAIAERGWPVMSAFEHALAAHGTSFAASGVVGAVGALAMTRQATRAPGALNALVAIAFACVVAAVATRSSLPAALAVVPAMMALLVRRLRVERVAIAAHDPAAGSELVGVRDALRAVWANARVIGRYAGAPATLRTTVALVLVVGGWHYMHRVKTAAPTTPEVSSSPFLPIIAIPSAPAPGAPTAYQISQAGTSIRIDADLDGAAIVIPGLGGLASVPSHWRANVDVLVDGDPVELTPFVDETLVDVAGSTHHFTVDACHDPVPLGIRIVPEQQTRYHVTIYVTPTLVPVQCPKVE